MNVKITLIVGTMLLFVLITWALTLKQETSVRPVPQLEVGFLPVTCHLTCPVTDFATKQSGTNQFVATRFMDFPTVVEAMKSGHLDATFMIAPLAMKIREQGVGVKIG